MPRRYEDGSGYYLKFTPTESEEGQEKAKKAFSDAYELQQEVCRVLGTEPAGETAIVVQEAHRKPSEAEQLAIDIKRGGGRADSMTAGHLIRIHTFPACSSRSASSTCFLERKRGILDDYW